MPQLLAAFNAVEDARLATQGRDGTPTLLTYFEFGTLAALWLFARADLDALVLEVGLGGRLDAVNIVDADVAVLTSVAIDHIDYLGPTREDIGREKAGIFRAGRPAVCADPHPPASVLAARAGRRRDPSADRPRLWLHERRHAVALLGTAAASASGCRFPRLRGAYQLANAATVLAVLDLLRDQLPVRAGALREGLLTVELPGRFQVLPGRPTIVLDVAHNPHAATRAGRRARRHGLLPADARGAAACSPTRTSRAWRQPCGRASIAGSLRRCRARAAPAPTSCKALLAASGVDASAVRTFADIGAAFAAAREAAGEADRIVVFGSFLTVAAALAATRR